MANNSVLQVPISQQVKIKSKKIALKQGFSSLQEMVRVFLSSVINDDVKVQFSSAAPSVKLSKEAVERYDKVIGQHEKDRKTGKSQLFNNADEAINFLDAL